MKFLVHSGADARTVSAHAAPHGSITTRVEAFLRAHTPSIKRSRCFFCRAGVIGMQCRSIRDCTVPTSPHIVARRAANGEEKEESGEEDGEAQEEEVAYAELDLRLSC